MSLETSIAIRIYVGIQNGAGNINPRLFDEIPIKMQQMYLDIAQRFIRDFDIKFKKSYIPIYESMDWDQIGRAHDLIKTRDAVIDELKQDVLCLKNRIRVQTSSLKESHNTIEKLRKETQEHQCISYNTERVYKMLDKEQERVNTYYSNIMQLMNENAYLKRTSEIKAKYYSKFETQMREAEKETKTLRRKLKRRRNISMRFGRFEFKHEIPEFPIERWRD